MYRSKCDILRKIQLQTVNSSSVFSLKCQITKHMSTSEVFGSSEECILLTM